VHLAPIALFCFVSVASTIQYCETDLENMVFDSPSACHVTDGHKHLYVVICQRNIHVDQARWKQCINRDLDLV